jgi:hypothetical protein
MAAEKALGAQGRLYAFKRQQEKSTSFGMMK